MRLRPLETQAIKLGERIVRLYRPRPHLTVAEWSEQFRRIPSGTSAASGRFRLDRLPYQREPMEGLTDPYVSETVLMWGSQLGKTEILLNTIGYFIENSPASMMVVYPAVDRAKDFSTKKMAKMIRETPVLHRLIRGKKYKESGNKILGKEFPGGSITLAGANSPSGLRQLSCRVVIQDEIDAYEADAGGEGDPMALADMRAENFHDAVFLKASSPTEKGFSRIDRLFEDSDKRYWHCPCPKCGHEQRLVWAQVKFDKDHTEMATYVCANPLCKYEWSDFDRVHAIMAGRWIATNPGKPRRGYHLSGLYKLMGKKKQFASYLHEFASDFLEAKRGGVQTLRVWVNTFLAEAFEEEAEKLDADPLLARCEGYNPAAVLPAGVLALVAAVDVQENPPRLEAEIKGVGLDEETWGVEYRVFPGNPAFPQVWQELDAWLLQKRKHPSGVDLTIAATCIDSGGHLTQKVYDYVKGRQYTRKIYAVKGSSQSGMPLVSRPRKSGVKKVILYHVGTDTAKSTIFARLRLDAFGPGYMHFPVGHGYDAEFFMQLTAEKIRHKYLFGKRVRVFEKTRERNEAIDINVYCLAAIALANLNLQSLSESMKVEDVEPEGPEDQIILEPAPGMIQAATAPAVNPTPAVEAPKVPRRRLSFNLL